MRGVEKLAIEERFYVYRHIRLDKNIPFYIGVGGINSAGNYARAYNTTQRNIFWKRIYQKTDIRVEIIFETTSYDEALEKEIEFIKLYGRINTQEGTLCNMASGGRWGGSGVVISDETKNKKSLSVKGRKFSQEIKDKFKIAQQKRWDEGSVTANVSIFQYTVDGLFVACYDSITKANKSINHKGSGICGYLYRNQNYVGGFLWYKEYKGEQFNPPVITMKYEKIVQLSLDGDYITTFDTMQKASLAIKGNTFGNNNIAKVCKGLKKHYKGYKWCYERDYLGINRTIQTDVN